MNLTRFARIFFTGLAVVLPIFITFAVMMWLVRGLEGVLGTVFQYVIPKAYFPGLGLIGALGMIFAIGLLMEGLLFQRLMSWVETLLNKIPLVKTVYGAVRDLMGMFAGGKQGFNKVVMLRVPGIDMQMLGFVTIETFTDLPIKPGDDAVAVYIPMSYQIGGHMVFVPRKHLTPVDMTLEEAMRFVVTAGMSRS